MLTESASKPCEVRAANSAVPEMPLGQLFFLLRSEGLLLMAAVRDKFGQNMIFKAFAFPFAPPARLSFQQLQPNNTVKSQDGEILCHKQLVFIHFTFLNLLLQN